MSDFSLAKDKLTKLDNGISPNKRFEVVLDEVELRFLIIELKTGKRVGITDYSADPHTDAQPLKSHVTVSWSPKGTAVALQQSERFYSSCSILIYDAKRIKFVDAVLPTYKEMTGFPQPDPKDLRPRGSSGFVEWTDRETFFYGIHLVPEPLYKGADPLEHTVELTLDPKGCKVVKKQQAEQDVAPDR